MKTTVFFFLATLVATSRAACLSNHIRLVGDEALEDCNHNPIHIPEPTSESGRLYQQKINCPSWRLAVETDNLIQWITVPSSCVDYVSNYMQGTQYRKDCAFVADIAINYAESCKLTGDGKDTWLVDLDETALSNLPYYARADVLFGSIKHNATKFNLWVSQAAAPADPAMLKLYKKLSTLGFKIVFIAGIHEYQRQALSTNLKNVGYTTWEKLILVGKADYALNQTVFKTKSRAELVAQGYRIIGTAGDQWSDITGENAGRTFKWPNPMYWVA